MATMPINSHLEDGAFGPEATAAMGEAFDAACEEFQIADQADARRRFVAASIIAAARGGELDPVRLRATAAALFAIRTSPAEVDRPKAARVAS
jgi:hypothetical protein